MAAKEESVKTEREEAIKKANLPPCFLDRKVQL